MCRILLGVSTLQEFHEGVKKCKSPPLADTLAARQVPQNFRYDSICPIILEYTLSIYLDKYLKLIHS